MTAPRDPGNKAGKKNKALDKKAIRDKSLGELTRADVEALMLELGTPELPFPMSGILDVEIDGEKHKEQHLTALAEENSDIALKLPTDRDPSAAWGILAREMPSPSMLGLFRTMVERLAPDSKNRQLFVLGEPGMGKSRMGGTLARAMSDDPARIYDCGGKQMNSMLFEMVLDFGSGGSVTKQLDKLIEKGDLDPFSVRELRRLAEEVGHEHIKEITDGKFEIDWETLAHGSKIGDENVKQVKEVLDEISRIEGLYKDSSNSIGMNSQFGPAIIDFIEGNFSTWDEYNKSKEGGDDQLQTFLQFVNGELDECTVENPLKGKDGVAGPTHFTFRREDVKPLWGIFFTGNNSVDGSTTRQLNKSVYSRLKPKDLPVVSKQDWHQAFCQLHTGVPISAWYTVFKDEADENPQAFADFLWMVRTAGMPQEKIDAIPPIQKVWLQNWRRVMDACENLAGTFDEWRDRGIEDNAHKYSLDDEIDQEYEAKYPVDFRLAKAVLDEAMKVKTEQKPLNSKFKIPTKLDFNAAKERSGKLPEEDPSDRYGTRLTNLIINEMFERAGAMGKPLLEESLKQVRKENALQEIDLQEGARSEKRTVEDLMNISEADSSDPSIRARVAQEMFCDMLRQRFPDITAENDQIITVERMQDIISEVEEQAAEARKTNELYLPSQDKKGLADNPFMRVKMSDFLDIQDDEEEVAYEDILTTEELLESFVLPGIKTHNLNAVWDSNVSLMLKHSCITEAIEENAKLMAGNAEALADLKKDLKAAEESLSEIEDKKASSVSEEQKDLERKIANCKSEIERLDKNNESLDQDTKSKQELLERFEKEGASVFNGLQDDEDDKNGVMANFTREDDESQNIAENRSKTGLGFTTIYCRIDDAELETCTEENPVYKPVHILRSNATDKTIVMASSVSNSLRKAFNKAKIKYIDLSADDAANNIDATIAEITRGMNKEDEVLKGLKGAFSLRNPANAVNQNDESQEETLGQSMTRSKEIICHEEEEMPVKYFQKPYFG